MKNRKKLTIIIIALLVLIAILVCIFFLPDTYVKSEQPHFERNQIEKYVFEKYCGGGMDNDQMAFVMKNGDVFLTDPGYLMNGQQFDKFEHSAEEIAVAEDVFFEENMEHIHYKCSFTVFRTWRSGRSDYDIIFGSCMDLT